jgi:hypothetical protein
LKEKNPSLVDALSNIYIMLQLSRVPFAPTSPADAEPLLSAAVHENALPPFSSLSREINKSNGDEFAFNVAPQP